MELPAVSVVIPTGRGGGWLVECIKSIREQDYPSERIEIIVVGDAKLGDCEVEILRGIYGVRWINHAGKPGSKRNIGADVASHDLIAFCDDDVVVSRDWLKNLVVHLCLDPDAYVAGGPNLTPENSGLLERCSGLVLSSRLGSASMASRYLPDGMKVKYATELDLTSCNMLVRREAFREFRFPEDLYPAEESVFLYQLSTRGHKILYVPNAVVWHRRRSSLLKHFLQVMRYGAGRACMVVRYPRSLRVLFLIPSTFLLYIAIGAAASLLVGGYVAKLYFSSILAYLLAIGFESARIALRARSVLFLLMLPVFFIAHHVGYGVGFLAGLVNSAGMHLSKRLKQGRVGHRDGFC